MCTLYIRYLRTNNDTKPISSYSPLFKNPRPFLVPISLFPIRRAPGKRESIKTCVQYPRHLLNHSDEYGKETKTLFLDTLSPPLLFTIDIRVVKLYPRITTGGTNWGIVRHKKKGPPERKKSNSPKASKYLTKVQSINPTNGGGKINGSKWSLQ